MPSYDFKMLSWVDFEELSRDLLASELECHVESFHWGADGGVDLRYTNDGKETIVQCKHYASSDFKTLYRDLKKELVKVEKLNPHSYRIITSLPLGYFQKEKIYALFKKYIPTKSYIWGKGDINGALGRSKNTHVEERHYKLWLTSTKVLKKLLNRKTYNSTDFNLSKTKQEIKLYVDNDSFPEALNILNKSHALIVSGPPGVGKTTLANMLMYHYIGKGFSPIYITGNVDEIYSVIDISEKQVIVFDDFLGQFRLDPNRFGNIDRRVQDLLNLVERSNNTRFILTTREHILKQAQEFSEHLSNKKIDYLKYVLDIGAYTRFVKAKILYNHLKYSSLPDVYLAEVLKDKFYKKIIDHPAFSPRVVSWIGEKRFYGQIKPEKFQDKLLQVLDDPTELWGIVYTSHLSERAKVVLIVISTMEGQSVKEVKDAFDLIYSKFSEFYNIQRTPSDFAKAIEEVENSLVKISIAAYSSETKISFINPSLHEFVEAQWRNNSDIQKIVVQNILYIKQLDSIVGMAKANKLESLAIAEGLKVSLYRIAVFIVDNEKYRGAVSFVDKMLWSLGDQITIKDKKKLLELLLPSIRRSSLSDDIEARKIADVVKAVAYLIDLEDESFKEILQTLKTLMLEVAETWNFVEIHCAYSNAIKEHVEHFTDGEAQQYKALCLNYIENANEDYNDRTWDELDEYKDNFSDLLNSYDMYDSSYIEGVDDRILELETEMAENADYEDSASSARTKDADATDGELDALFASLTDNRE